MSKEITVFSLNIQGECHLHRFIEQVRNSSPDVVFLQEVPEHRAAEIARLLGMVFVRFDSMSYAPIAYEGRKRESSIWGLLTCVRSGIHVVSHSSYCYHGLGDEVFLSTEEQTFPVNRILQLICISQGVSEFRLSQTHFTWTPEGECSPQQLIDLLRLLECLQVENPHALFGDLNAPRGINKVWDILSERYRDNIPHHILSTLDEVLHRVGHLQRVVDACFTDSMCRASSVEVLSGLSDHKGIYAKLHICDT